MQVGIGLGLRVLLGNARAELEVGTHGLAERLVVWQTGLVERFHVQRNEPLPLLVSDLQVAVRIDHVLKAELAREAVRPRPPPNDSAMNQVR